MADQERIAQPTDSERPAPFPMPVLGADGAGAASTYVKGREALSQRFDQVLASLQSGGNAGGSAGPSLALSQNRAHQVAGPTRSTRVSSQGLSLEEYVRGFRQTTGE